MIALELHSPESPDVVLAALRTRSGEWRESQIPRELWSVGISGVECEVHGTTCALYYERRWYGANAVGQFLRALATVEPETGGTRVRVVVVCRMRNVALFVIGSVFAACMSLVLRMPIGLTYLALPLGVIATSYLGMWVATRSLSRGGDPLADYLVRRIETAVSGSNP
jgi:hypothetical protein